MISLETAEQIFTSTDFEEFENLHNISGDEEYLSPQWYSTREMMQEILNKYPNINDNDPFDMD